MYSSLPTDAATQAGPPAVVPGGPAYQSSPDWWSLSPSAGQTRYQIVSPTFNGPSCTLTKSPLLSLIRPPSIGVGPPRL